MRTQEQYLERLKGMRHNIFLNGECIGRDDPRIIKASSAIRMTFSMVDNSEMKDLMTATSHVTGKVINRFTHIHQNPEDLLKKQEMTRKICGICGGCVQRCMGIDMMNAVSSVVKDVDDKYGTTYYRNFLKFLEYFQNNDLVCAGSQTDTKGDRAARPSEQWDPDQYLHVVERCKDGVVVRGCKVHNTMAPYADELIILPTRVMGHEEKDYAIAFAIPADTEGIYLIGREAFSAEREPNLDAPITAAGDIESMTVFDNVFIPNERIFLNGETEFAGKLALRFALYHRHSYTGCKPGIGDVLMGTTALIADYQNISKQSHVKEKLAEMISVAELTYAAGIAAAVKSEKASSGTQVPNVIFANVGRRHAGHSIYHEFNMLCDVTGGLPATIPQTKEYNNPIIGNYIRKYITRRKGVSPEDCYRAFLLANDLLCGEYSSVIFQVAGVHGGGSPIMEDIAILGSYDLKKSINIAKHLAGIEIENEAK